MLGNIELPQRHSELTVYGIYYSFPTRGYFLLSLERFVVKSKVLILERRREIRRSVFKRVKTQIGLPLFNGRIHKHLVHFFEEFAPVKIRCDLVGLANAHEMIEVVWIVHFDRCKRSIS